MKAALDRMDIETRRYSHVVQAFLTEFPDARAYLDKKEQTGSSHEWATNKALLAARDFALIHEGTELLGFHDGPYKMWASTEAHALVLRLKEEQVLRLSKAEPNMSLIQRLRAWLQHGNGDA